MQKYGMAKRSALQLLAVALIVAVGLLGLHAAVDWNAHTYDGQRCQTCQIAHAAAPQLVVQVVVQSPTPVARFAPAEDFHLDLEESRSLSIPRAPPA